MDPLLDMTVAQHGDGYEIALRGELDADTAPLALPNLRAAVDTATVVTVDLHDLAYIDQAGADALYSTRQRARSRGHDLIVFGALAHIEAHLAAAGFTDPPPLPPPEVGAR